MKIGENDGPPFHGDTEANVYIQANAINRGLEAKYLSRRRLNVSTVLQSTISRGSPFHKLTVR